MIHHSSIRYHLAFFALIFLSASAEAQPYYVNFISDFSSKVVAQGDLVSVRLGILAPCDTAINARSSVSVESNVIVLRYRGYCPPAIPLNTAPVYTGWFPLPALPPGRYPIRFLQLNNDGTVVAQTLIPADSPQAFVVLSAADASVYFAVPTMGAAGVFSLIAMVGFFARRRLRRVGDGKG